MERPCHPTQPPCVAPPDPQQVQQTPLMSVEHSDCMETEMGSWASSWTGGTGLVKLILDLVENKKKHFIIFINLVHICSFAVDYDA